MKKKTLQLIAQIYKGSLEAIVDKQIGKPRIV
jgi:hypothetical protein